MSNLFSLLWSRDDLVSEELRSERRLVVRAGSLYSVVVSSSSRIATNVTLDARTFVRGLGVRRWAFGTVPSRGSPGRAPKRPNSARGLPGPKNAPI